MTRAGQMYLFHPIIAIPALDALKILHKAHQCVCSQIHSKVFCFWLDRWAETYSKWKAIKYKGKKLTTEANSWATIERDEFLKSASSLLAHLPENYA